MIAGLVFGVSLTLADFATAQPPPVVRRTEQGACLDLRRDPGAQSYLSIAARLREARRHYTEVEFNVCALHPLEARALFFEFSNANFAVSYFGCGGLLQYVGNEHCG